MANVSRLHEMYNKEIVPELEKELKISNAMQVPKLEKIILSLRLGAEKDNSKSFNLAVDELQAIAGQKPVITKAKKSIAGFKLRAGQPIGCKVTLRGERMYEFLDKLFNISLPRVRDFHGVSATAFDGRGNYTLGVKEQLIFPEINFDKVNKVRGMDVVIVTTAKTNNEAHALLKEMGMPFTK